MGKVLWTEDEDQFNNPGCISGIFHALHHQNWQSNVKKIIPHTSHKEILKHAKRHRRYTRVSDNEDSCEILKLLDPETSHILVDNRNTKTNTTQKRSLKARIKALVSDESLKGGNNKEYNDYVPSPRLQRTYSVHHSESNEWVHPIVFFPENANTESPSVKKSDILDMFEVDKELFTNILQESTKCSDIKPKLTKSGSFPSNRNLKPTLLKDKLNDFYTKSKSKKFDSSNSNNDNSMRIKRASSVNESGDRYARLFDFGIGNGNEAALWPSRSMKLTKGSENFLNVQEPSFLTRNQSLSHERNTVSLTLELDSTQDCERLNEVRNESDNLSEDEHSSCVSESCPQEEEVQSDFQISKGSDLVNNSHENLEEIKTININTQIKSKLSRRHYKDDDDFTYVKEILERSGFIKNGFEQTWHSSNQPLNPFVFQEIESEYVHDPDKFVEELNELSHRLLIFELVDEILLTMYERSLTYYPKSLSSLCHIYRVPCGDRVLNEVWKRVSQMLDLKPDMGQSLDCIMLKDLGSDDGWMNLQLDSECVALDLEDLILDDLLEELLCEL